MRILFIVLFCWNSSCPGQVGSLGEVVPADSVTLNPGVIYAITVAEEPGKYYGTTDVFSTASITGPIIRELQVIPYYPSPQPADTAKKILVDVDILISDQETGVPIPEAKVHIYRADGPSLDRTSDAYGRISINEETAPGFMAPGYNYAVEVEGVTKKYLGESVAFTTVGITQNTRIIRELYVLNKVCVLPFPEIVFLPGSYKIDTLLADSLHIYVDLLIENPTIIMELNCFYKNKGEITLAEKRVQTLIDWFVENGIRADRFVTRISEKPELRKMINPYGGNIYTVKENRDAEIQISSFDYKPEP